MMARPIENCAAKVLLCLLCFLITRHTFGQVCVNPSLYVYGLSTSGRIYQVNVTNADVAPAINTPLATPSSPNALGYNGANGKFYFFNKNYSNAQFVSYDASTGTYEVLATPPVTNSVVTGCINQDGTGYYCLDVNAVLFYYNIASNSWTKITTTFYNQSGSNITNTMRSAPSGDMAFDGNGNLWFVIAGSGKYGLYELTAPIPTTTVASVTMRQVISPGATVPDGSIVAGIAFNATGEIYLSTTGDHLYIVNDDLTTTLKGTFSTAGVGQDLTSCNYPTAVLSMRFINFNHRISNDNLILTWTVSQVESVNRFLIEFSKDGIAWSAIDSVNAIPGKSAYSKPIAHNGLSYYRIYLQNSAGVKTYSPVHKVAAALPESTQKVWPNPATSGFFIQNRDVMKRELTILNTQGVHVKQHILEAGTNAIDISALPTGTYYLRYQQGNEYLVIKLLRN